MPVLTLRPTSSPGSPTVLLWPGTTTQGWLLSHSSCLSGRTRGLIYSLQNKHRAHLCMKCPLGISNFLEEISSLPPFCCFPLFLCIDHRGKLSYLSVLFFGSIAVPPSQWSLLSFSAPGKGPLCPLSSRCSLIRAGSEACPSPEQPGRGGRLCCC